MESLTLGGNYMINFSALTGLTSLKFLDLSQTNFQDVTPLAGLENLESLDITGSGVADISPLESHPNLKKIAADETKLTPLAADAFVRKNPRILLIHHVKDLESWWSSLSEEWRTALKQNNPLITTDSPGIETLTQAVTVTELDLDSAQIDNLIPITRFVNLARLNISNNPISDLLPLSEVRTLVKLEGKNTSVEDLSVLRENDLLEFIDLEFSPVQSILSVTSLPRLTF